MTRQPASDRRRAFSMSRWISQHRRDQRGLTLLETLMALVVTATVLLPTLGFITLSMGEQASARTLTQETSNLAAADLALVRDVSNAKAAASSTAENGDPRGPGELRDCSGGPGAGGEVVLAMVSSTNDRIVYSLEPLDIKNPQLGHNLWRRTCPNKSTTADYTLADDLLNRNPPPADMSPTKGYKLAQRVGNAVSSCPDGRGGQNLECRQVTLSLRSVDRSKNGIERPPVVIEATRRNTSYAAPDAAPIARFTWDPNRVEDLDEVTFDASGSRDPRGGVLEYNWKFEGPLNVNEPGALPAYSGTLKTVKKTIPERTTSPGPSSMMVTLTVINTAGKTASDTQEVILQPKAPIAILQPGSGINTSDKPLVAIANKDAQFLPDLKTFSGATIASTEWDWGDGTKAVVCAPGGRTCTTPGIKKFTTPNLYFVKVTVTDSNGRTAFAQVAVRVEPDTLFVATTGTDSSACGPIASPCRQIDYGLGQAQSQGRLKVHVEQGAPYNRFSARSNIDVVGGWKDNFADPNGTRSVVTGSTDGPSPYGIYVHGVHNARVEGFEVRTPDATGGTTQGILVDAGSGDNATNRVELKKIKVTGGRGNQPSGVLIEGGSWVSMDNVEVISSPEAVGPGSSTYAVRVLNSNLYSKDGGYFATNGRDAADADDTKTAPAKANAGCNGLAGLAGGRFFGSGGNGAPGCGGTSGWGGNGGTAYNDGDGGLWGLQATGGAGGAYKFWDSIAGWGGEGSQYQGPGGSAGNGGGKLNAPVDPLVPQPVWVGNNGKPGGDGGVGGGGAGGGGGGGNNCCAAGGGGAGGGGGEPGKGGSSGGGFGGGSFGIYAFQSVVNVDGGGILTGNGGRGGPGQPGGQGGTGGNGGNGGPDTSAEGGGGGGAGSGGGGGGGAGGGAGGPSALVYLNKSSGNLNGVGGAPGNGGDGGPGGARGPRGDRGQIGIGDNDHNGGNAAFGVVGGVGGNGASGVTGIRVVGS